MSGSLKKQSEKKTKCENELELEEGVEQSIRETLQKFAAKNKEEGLGVLSSNKQD